MHVHLQFGHRHEVVLVEPPGQLAQHLVFLATQQDRFQGCTQAVEFAVADDLAMVILDLVRVEQLEGRPQAKTVPSGLIARL